MKVLGVEIGESQVGVAIARMKRDLFTAGSIAEELHAVGVPRGNSVCLRAADRIIQKQRKLGNIAFNGAVRFWYWIGK